MEQKKAPIQPTKRDFIINMAPDLRGVDGLPFDFKQVAQVTKPILLTQEVLKDALVDGQFIMEMPPYEAGDDSHLSEEMEGGTPIHGDKADELLKKVLSGKRINTHGLMGFGAMSYRYLETRVLAKDKQEGIDMPDYILRLTASQDSTDAANRFRLKSKGKNDPNLEPLAVLEVFLSPAKMEEYKSFMAGNSTK